MVQTKIKKKRISEEEKEIFCANTFQFSLTQLDLFVLFDVNAHEMLQSIDRNYFVVVESLAHRFQLQFSQSNKIEKEKKEKENIKR